MSLKMPSIVLSLMFSLRYTFLRNIHSDDRFLGTPSKEVLYLNVRIAKYIYFFGKHEFSDTRMGVTYFLSNYVINPSQGQLYLG